MTSPSFNARRLRAAEEMAIFDALPSAVRDAINQAHGSVRASSARDALLRGVAEATIVETIMKSVTKEPEDQQPLHGTGGESEFAATIIIDQNETES